MEQAAAKSYSEIHNTLTVPCEKSWIVSFDFSIMKSIAVSTFISWLSAFFRLRFPVKLIYCIAFGSSRSAGCLLKSVAIIL